MIEWKFSHWRPRGSWKADEGGAQTDEGSKGQKSDEPGLLICKGCSLDG